MTALSFVLVSRKAQGESFPFNEEGCPFLSPVLTLMSSHIFFKALSESKCRPWLVVGQQNIGGREADLLNHFNCEELEPGRSSRGGRVMLPFPWEDFFPPPGCHRQKYGGGGNSCRSTQCCTASVKQHLRSSFPLHLVSFPTGA